MKKRMVPWVLTLAVVFAFSLVSCKADDSDDKGGKVITGYPTVDYQSYNDYSVMVKNNTSYNLVAFKGSPSKANLIGGIPANATIHKLKKDDSLFATSQDFMLFIVKEDDYKNMSENLSALENSPFANIYAYYNTNSDNQMVYEISSRLGGQGTITMYNTSGFNIELRLNGINGKPLGYIGDGMLKAKFKVALNDSDFTEYNIFPVFRKYNSSINEIMTVYPKYGSTMGAAAGKAICERFELSANGDTDKVLRSTNWIGSDYEINSGYAYLTVSNNHSQAVDFFDGDVQQVSSTGNNHVNFNREVTFTIQMPEAAGSTPGNRKYLSEKHVAAGAYKIGLPGATAPLPARTYKSGYQYKITVSGKTIYDVEISEIKVIGKYDFVSNVFTETNTDSE